MKRLLCVYLVVLLAILAGCGDDGRTDAGIVGEFSSGEQGTFEEGTLALTTGPGKKSSPEGTLREGTDETGNAVLRLEGDPDTTFSGICTVGGEEQVLTGRVPKQFVFDLGAGSLECRIQKQDAGRGGLNAVLTVDNSTRSAQQINRKGATIKLSYKASSGG